MPKRSFLTFRKNYTLSDLERTVAEKDDLLSQYYVDRQKYVDRALNFEDRASIFIGPKGVGKSAVLQMVRLDQQAARNEKRLIEIAPDDLAFNSLINIETRTPLLKQAGQHQWLFTSLWDYVLSVELLMREHSSTTGLTKLFSTLFGSRHEKEQAKLLKLTLNDNGNQSSMTDKMLRLIKAIEAEGSYGDGNASIRIDVDPSKIGVGGDLVLLQLINNVAKNLPKNLSHKYYILIDDLDYHWRGTPLENAFLAAMFSSIRKLTNSETVKFVVSLRKNIYREIALTERDKYSQFICEVAWTKTVVKQMIQKRVTFAMQVIESEIWNGLFTSNTFDLLWERSFGVPRDVIRLVVKCVAKAMDNGSSSVTEEDVNQAIHDFSVDRADDMCSQYIHQFPMMIVVLKQFKGGPKQFKIEHLREIGFKVMEAVKNHSEELNWATAAFEDPCVLGRSLLMCGFLMFKDGRAGTPRIPVDDEIACITNESWVGIHPTFHAGLEL